MNRKLLFSLFCFFVFFIASFLTLKDYGISWDETIHFRRGQAYLHYFLTGELIYDLSVAKKSLYQSDIHNGEYFIRDDVGHPPINDEAAAIFNYVFFQKLGLMGDIESHHLFNIFMSSVLVFIVAFFAYETLGFIPALVSVLSLTLYPLFWAESHFNIKDPPLAAFFAGFIWAFYKSLKNFSIKWLIIATLFFSLGLGTKFNIFFAIPIVALYTVYRYWGKIVKTFFLIPKGYLILLFLSPFASLIIFTVFWPFLWSDWLANILKIFNYYKNIGTITKYQPESFYLAGFNTFPIKWIFYTTPPVVTFLSTIGLISAWFKRRTNTVFILWTFWLLISILRVTFPETSIYGGVRQIMEYIPALALLSGLGAYQVSDWFKNKKIVLISIILVFIWPVFILFKMHPNENVYFNFLIGGLKGAQSENFPSWGNSFGNAYQQGVLWLNMNAEKDVKLTLIQGTSSNIPVQLLRSDINYLVDGDLDSSKTYFSGIERKGEYIMELVFNDTAREYNYAWEYTDTFLIPTYDLKVDGVTILKIWKNDMDHTKSEYKLQEINYNKSLITVKNKNLLTVDLNREAVVSRILLSYTSYINCFPVTTSFVETSKDGINWIKEKDRIPYRQIGSNFNNVGNEINYFIAGKKARFLRFWLDNSESCALGNPEISVKVLK